MYVYIWRSDNFYKALVFISFCCISFLFSFFFYGKGPGGSMGQVVVGGPGGSMGQVVGLPNNSYKPITNTTWVRARLCKLQKGCTRLASASDKVYQLLAHGRWFSPGTPVSSTTKTGHHDITEILLIVVLNTINQIKYFTGT